MAHSDDESEAVRDKFTVNSTSPEDSSGTHNIQIDVCDDPRGPTELSLSPSLSSYLRNTDPSPPTSPYDEPNQPKPPSHQKGRRFTNYWDNHILINANQNSLDRPPVVENYRNSIDIGSTRPTLTQLMAGDTIEALDEFEKNAQKQVDDALNFTETTSKASKTENFVSSVLKGPQGRKYAAPPGPTPPPGQKPRQGPQKFGWIIGVLVRCIQSIFGVILYIRVAWVAGQAGIVMGNGIVILASVVTTITALSTCAICTNGDVKGGGAYFLISRSLGPEFGGSIGLIFSLANAVGAAMYIVGFAETMRDLLKEYGIQFIDGGLNDVRLMGLLAALILITIVFIGTGFESKMQVVLLGVQFMAIGDYFIGTFLPPSEDLRLRGLTGYSVDTIKDNFWPVFRDGYGFFQTFSIYFPAATGIMAGANISGDLANPQKAIPRGTLLSIAFTTVIYMLLVFCTGATVVRDADGVHVPVLLTAVANQTLAQENGLFAPKRPWAAYFEPQCAQNSTCPYGLMNYFQIIEMGSLWGPLITAGILTSSLSSALASLVGAPKVFQAVCNDKLFPYIKYFAKTFGKDEEPRRAYALTFIICCLIIGIGDLNLIAPIISNFFLCSYALVNYACFDCSMAKTPGFRPAFKYYNKWVSLVGAILCISVMFVMNWFTALLTFFFFALLFLYMHHRKPEVNWGSTLQAHNYRNALQSVTKLERTDEHVKNYRPQILLLTGNPASRPSLIDFFSNITKDSCLLTCGYVVPCEKSEIVTQLNKKFAIEIRAWFKKRHIKAFYTATANKSLKNGAANMMQTVGLGKLRPNILAMGFKQDWLENPEKLKEMNEYYNIIQEAFENQMGLLLLRSDELGFDFETMMSQIGAVKNRSQDDRKNAANTTTTSDDGYNPFSESMTKYPKMGDQETCLDYDKFELSLNVNALQKRPHSRMTTKQRQVAFSLARFKDKIKKGVIDVWWLYDDGGLALLIPYLLTQPKSYLENAKLRVFSISTSHDIKQEQKSMAELLAKFRINVANLTIINDHERPPSQETVRNFLHSIRPFYGEGEGMINDSELELQKERTIRQLRVAELLREHSSEADLVVVSMPIPRKGIKSGALYLSWLELMTKDMPPTLFVRGNQQSVLTFYS
uniref:Solute carrier family 12 member 3 n=1 Tax=Bursaphelenchus xylophilus TaxID=6326 RepID=A0A1I7RP02_BURXY